MGAPSLITPYNSTYGTSTTPKTVTVNAQAGDILLLFVMTSDWDSATSGTPTNSGTALTWTQIAIAGTTTYAPVVAWKATVDTNRTGMVITETITGTDYWGFSVAVWRGSDGVGASAFARGWNGAGSPAVNSATPYVNITTTQANSAIQFMSTDWEDGTGAATFRTTAGAVTSMLEFTGVGSNTYMARHNDVGAIGSKTVGMSSPANHKWAMVAVEVKGALVQDIQVAVEASVETTTSLEVRRNLAPSATPTVSSGSASASKLNDNLLTSSEWVGTGTVGQWAQLTWATPVALSSVVLYDRVDANNQILTGTLTFSDGSSVAVGALPNAGTTGLEITFDGREVTWVRLTVNSVSGTTTAVGLTEFQAFRADGMQFISVGVDSTVTIQTSFSILSALQERGEFEVAVFDRTDLADAAVLGIPAVPIAYIPNFADLSYLDERNRDGGGSLRVPLEMARTDYANAIQYGRIIRVGISGTVIGWFEIEKIAMTQVADEAWVTVSGQGPLAWSSRAVVFPDSPVVAAGYTAPTISSVSSTFVAGGTRQSPSFAADSGDYLVVMAVAAADAGTHLGTPTNSGTALTWTLLQEVYESAHGMVAAWSAQVDTNRSSMTVSMTWGVTNVVWGFTTFRARNSAGIGTSVKKTRDSGEPNVRLTTLTPSSAILVGHEDWHGKRSKQSWRDVNGAQPQVVKYEWVSAPDTLSIALYSNVGTAGGKTVGMTWPEDQMYSMVAVEVKGVKDVSATVSFGPTAKNRRFDFTSPTGDWYNAAEWVPPTIVRDVDPINSNPEDWPDFDSWTKWVWDRSPDGSGNFPAGDIYLRGTFSTSASQSVELYATVDDVAVVVLDGEVIATMDAENEWEKTTRASMNLKSLPAGNHVLAVHARSIGGPAGVAIMLRTMADDPDDSGDLIIRTGSNDSMVGSNVSWKVCGYPARRPGWTVGQMLMPLFDEATNRTVDGLNRLAPTFTSTVDSNGISWAEIVPWAFPIGTSYRDVLERVIQTTCDVWVDQYLNLNVAQVRGRDVSDSVMFAPGFNIIHAESQPPTKELVNHVLVETKDGYQLTHDPVGSSQQFGRREMFFAAPIDGTLDMIVNRVWAVQAWPNQHPTIEIEAVQGAIPWRDFVVGDWVLAPSDSDPVSLVRRRVVSIGVSQDSDTGVPRYELEIDSIRDVSEIEMARRMERATSGLLSYFEYTPNPTSPEDVEVGNRRKRHRSRGHRRCGICHKLMPHKNSHDGLHAEDEELWGDDGVRGLWWDVGTRPSDPEKNLWSEINMLWAQKVDK